MRRLLFAVCIIAATGTPVGWIRPASAQLTGGNPMPSPVCGTPTFSDPTVIPQAISNTKRDNPATYRLMQKCAEATVLEITEDTLGIAHQFFVYNFASKDFRTVSAVLMAKGELTEIWVDKTELANGHVDSSVVLSIKDALENQTPQGSKNSNEGIVRLEESYFGMPPNSGESNGFIHFLITDIKDNWDSTKSTSPFVAGFFLSNDQPGSYTGNYGYGSNKRDLLYIDSYPGIYNRGTRNPARPLPTLAHEFQHLIHWRYDPNEVTFLDEGCSTNAEVFCGYPMRSPSGYFENTNVSLFTWHPNTDKAVLADYSRATIFMRYLFEQFGDSFAKGFVQNPKTGIDGISSTLAEIGSGLTFNGVFRNWAVANALNDTAAGRQYGYRYPIAARPLASKKFSDPNVCLAYDTTFSMAASYLDFTAGDSLIVSYNSSGLDISAVEFGGKPAVKRLSSSDTFYEPQFGSVYKGVTLSLLNLATSGDGNITLTSSGGLTHIRSEAAYDLGRPDTLSGATFLCYPNGSAGSGWAVGFTPVSSNNQLVGAEIYALFAEENRLSARPTSEPKQFIMHVWEDNNGHPGADLVTPFVVQVNRSSFDNSFIDVDLTRYAERLTNLKGPVYVGFTEGDSLSTSVGLNHQTSVNHTYAFSQPRFGGWTNMSTLSVKTSGGSSQSLEGWNLMMRAVFDYPTISSPPPKLTVGFTQGPLPSSQLDLVCIGDSDLRPESICGALAQGSGSTLLRFSQVSPNRFISTNAFLRAGGTIGINLKAAKLPGSNYADTAFVFNTALAGGLSYATLVSADSLLELTIPPIDGQFFATIYKGTIDTVDDRARFIYSLGPKGKEFPTPVQIVLNPAAFDTNEFIPAFYRDWKWYGVPFSLRDSSLACSATYFSTFAVIPKEIITGPLSPPVPKVFALYQNYPNPFNLSTAINYHVPVPSNVTLKVYDILGRKVRTLVCKRQDAGSHTISLNGTGLASGVYLYRLVANPVEPLTGSKYISTKKMILIK